MLPIIQQQLYHYGEKSIVWCCNPAQQFYVLSALKLCRIDCRTYHAELTHAERQELITDFTIKPDEATVLICSYYVNTAGSNLQHLCCNVHLFDTPTSDPFLQQAIGCVCQLGQLKMVHIYDYQVKDSFNMTVIKKNLLKAIPDLATQLNTTIFEVSMGLEVDGSQHELV